MRSSHSRPMTARRRGWGFGCGIRVSWLLIPGALLAAPGVSAGQQINALDRALVPVEQGVEDVSPVAESLRYVDPRTTQSPQFDQLWRLRGTGYFLRIEGAVHAVFRQSDYRFTPLGFEPAIPADTVFYLEPPTHLLAESAGVEGSQERWGPAMLRESHRSAESPWISNRVSTRLDRFVSGPEPGESRQAEDPQPSRAPLDLRGSSVLHHHPQPKLDAESEKSRARRVGQLLRLALEEPTTQRD